LLQRPEQCWVFIRLAGAAAAKPPHPPSLLGVRESILSLAQFPDAFANGRRHNASCPMDLRNTAIAQRHRFRRRPLAPTPLVQRAANLSELLPDLLLRLHEAETDPR
jgi:hypothetical protein